MAEVVIKGPTGKKKPVFKWEQPGYAEKVVKSNVFTPGYKEYVSGQASKSGIVIDSTAVSKSAGISSSNSGGAGGTPAPSSGASLSPPAQEQQAQVQEADQERKYYKIVGADKTQVYATKSYFEYLAQEEAKKQAGGVVYTEPGVKELKVGSVTTAISPEKYTETIHITGKGGGQTFIHESVPDPGYKYDVSEPKVTETPITAKLTISEEMAQAGREKRATSTAVRIVETAGPLERAGLEARTLLSEKGMEYIGGAILGTRTKAVEQKVAQDLLMSRIEKPIDTFFRGVVEGVQSPVVEIETALLGGVALGGTKAGAKIIGTKIGKTVLYGAGTVGIGMRAYDIKTSIDTGNLERAIGLGLTTVADVGVAYAGYKYSQPKTPKIGTKIHGAKGREVDIDLRHIDKTLDVAGGKKIEPLKTSELKLTTKQLQSLGDDLVKTEHILKPKLDTITTKTGKTFYVQREKSGEFFKFGLEKSILRDVGIKSKMPKVDQLVKYPFVSRQQEGLAVQHIISDKGTTSGAIQVRQYTLKSGKLPSVKLPKDLGLVVKAPKKLPPMKPFKITEPSEISPSFTSVSSRGGSLTGLKAPKKTVDLVLDPITGALGKAKPITIYDPFTASIGRESTAIAGIVTLKPVKILDEGNKKKLVMDMEPLSINRFMQAPDFGQALKEIKSPKLDDFSGTRLSNLLGPGQASRVSQRQDIMQKLYVPSISEPRTAPSLDIPGFPAKTIEKSVTMPPMALGFPALPLEPGMGRKRSKYGTRIILNPVPDLKDIL